MKPSENGEDDESGGNANDRRTRIKRLIRLAKRIADPGDALGIEARKRLPFTSGLSSEGIELALTRHLETNPSELELTSLLASAQPSREKPPPRCHVVIASNVCTSALRSIALALATSPTVLVRPSSRDPVLAEILVRELGGDDSFRHAGGFIALTDEIAATDFDEIHIYGSDETITTLRSSAPPSAVVRGHGTGFGIAIIGATADLKDAANKLTDDVVPFDQRGCLSPRIALVEGLPERAEAFAEILARLLARSPIPRGRLDRATQEELRFYRSSIEAIGVWKEGASHSVGFDPAPRALLLPPSARVVHIAPASAETIPPLLGPFARYIAAVGFSGEGLLLPAVLGITPRSRVSNLGKMQRPPLDGPVDLRTD